MALAAIGLASLSSCSYTENLNEEFELEAKEASARTEYVQRAASTPTFKRADSLFKALGLFKNDTVSIKNVETICCLDNENTQHWMRPTGVYNNVIYGEGLTILSDCSEGSKYSFMASNASNGGLNVTKTFRDGTKTVQNYVLKNDGTIVECDVIDNKFMLEKSTYKKEDDGTITQTFAD